MEQIPDYKRLFNPTVYEEAKRLYSVGERHYHTFAHAIEVIGNVLLLNDEVGFVDLKAALLAALFHDCIYKVGDVINNEASSARAMRMLVELHDPSIPKETLIAAHIMIMATAEHGKPDRELGASSRDWDCRLLMDADMLGFAAPWDTFKAKNALIDAEFGKNIIPIEYRSSRRIFLRNLRAKGVFRAPPVRRRYETNAIINIDQALHELSEENLSAWKQGPP